MDDTNPFHPRKPARKRIVNLSVTEAQEDAIDSLATILGLDSRAAVLKRGLADLHDRYLCANHTDRSL